MRIGPFFHSSEDTEYEVAGIAITLAETEPFDPYGSSWTGIWIYKDAVFAILMAKKSNLSMLRNCSRRGLKTD